MKNLMMTICLAMVVLAGVGCRDTVPKYDPNKNEWKLWAKGVVEKAYIRTSSGTRNFTIEFVNSSDVFKNSTFLNFNDVKVGDRGCIYVWVGWEKYFMWVPSDGIFNSFAKKEADPISVKDFIADMKPTTPKPPIVIIPTKYEWQSAVHQPPAFNKTVIIEFEDGLLTMGYYTRTKKWKTDVGRRKMSGGVALNSVARWKLVDLE